MEKRICQHLWIGVLVAQLIIPPYLWAGSVIPDPNAAAGKRPTMDVAPNNVPVVNITSANSSGLSHNQYHDFSVNKQGVILNNNHMAGVSQLGGAIMGNPNFKGSGSEARAILNEVTSSNRSYIQGYIEVNGRAADVILSNPNGVTMNGGGYINVPRATVTTGTPNVQDGVIRGYDVRKGDVRIEGAGVNASNTDAFSIISHTANIAAEVYANDLTVVTGRNTVDTATGKVAPHADVPENERPKVGIDSSALGGMYANRITLIATEKGVGVNLEGTVQSANDMIITADGKLVLRSAVAGGDASLSSSTGVDVQGSAYAGKNMTVQSQQTVNVQGTVAAGATASLAAGNVTLTDSTLASGVDAKGSITKQGSTQIVATQKMDIKNSKILSGKDIHIAAADSKLESSTMAARKSIALSGNHLAVMAGQIQADSVLMNTVQDIQLQQSAVESLQSVALTTQNLSLDTSTLLSNGIVYLEAATANLQSSSMGALGSLGIVADTFTMHEGKIFGDTLNIASKQTTADQKAQLYGYSGVNASFASLVLNDATLTSGQDMLLNFDTLTIGKDGLVSATNNLLLQGTTLGLTGGIATAGQDLGFKGTTLSNVGGVLFAARDQYLLTDGNLTNDGGQIYAGNNITIASASGARTNNLYNISGTIAAAGGNLDITAATVENRKRVLNIARKAYRIDFYKYEDNYRWGDRDEKWWDRHQVTITQDALVEDSPSALLTAANNLIIRADKTTNAYSRIAAGANLGIDADKLTQISTSLNRNLDDRVEHAHDDEDGDLDLDGGVTYMPTQYTLLQAFNATIVANQVLDVSVTDTLLNYNEMQNANTPPPYVGNGASVSGGVHGEYPLSNNPMFRPSTAPGHRYRIETNPAFTNLGLFYGSDYFLGRMGIDLAAHHRVLLGDAFYETRLVQDQILSATGKRFLGSYSTDADQMRGLMDAAADQATGLKLALGVELSPQQVAALTQDIIWLVEEEYMGEKVLVPHLYLASASQQDIITAGASMSGREVNLVAGSLVNQGGLIEGKQTLTALADQMRNSGGTLMGGDLNLVAKNDIINSGGLITGNTLAMTAGGNILSETTTHTLRGTGGSAVHTVMGDKGAIVAKDSLLMQAGNDITLKGSTLGAGGDATLTAGRNVNVQSVTTGYDNNFHHLTEKATTNTGSQIATGGNLNITAQNDMTVAGSSIAAGKDAKLVAGNNLSVVATQDTFYEYKRGSSYKGLFGGSSSMSSIKDKVTNQGSSISAQGNLTVVAGAGNPTAGNGNVAVVGSGLASGQDLTVAAKGNVLVSSAQDSNYYSSKSSSNGLFSSSSKAKGETSLTQRGSSLLGNNVTVDAGKNVLLSASTVQSLNNTSLIARDGDVQLLSAQNQSSSWSKSQKSSFGLSFGSGEGTFSINYSKGTKRSDEAMSGTSVGSFIQAGKDVSIVAKRDVTSIGSAVLANQDVAINAGRDVNLTPGLNTTYEEHKKGTTTQGLTFTLTETKAGVFAGLTSEEKSKSIATTADQGSHIGAGRDVLIKAGEDVNIVGSSLQANRDMALDAGGSINVLEGRATEDIKAWQRNMQAGLMLEATQNVTTSVKEIYNYGKNINKTLGAVKGADQAISEGSNAIMTAGKLGDILNPKVSIQLGVGVTGSYQEQWSHTSKAIGSNLVAGNDLVLQAQKDLHIRGSQVQAGNTAILSADTITIESAQNLTESGSWGQKFSAFAGFKAHAGLTQGYEPPAGFNVSLGYGTNRANSDGMAQNNAGVSAGGLLGIESKKDTTIAGANLQGGNVVMNVGQNLTVASRKDSEKSSSTAASGKVSVTVSYGSAGASVEGSVAANQSQSDLVGQQTSIVGINGVDITVGQNTDLKGAAIIALNDKLKLDTGTLSYSNMEGNASTHGFAVGGSLSGTQEITKTEQGLDTSAEIDWEPSSGALSLTALNQDQIARATIGKGEIVIRDTPDQNIGDLNRDPTLALKLEDKTGFSISIASPNALYKQVTTIFGITDAIEAWTWNPKDAEMKALKEGLKNKPVSESEIAAAKTPEDLRKLYDGKDIPAEADILGKFNTEVRNPSSWKPVNWQYSQYKAQDAYSKRWTIGLPLDVVMPKP